MAHGCTLRTVRQTFDELRRFGEVYDRLKDHRPTFQVSVDLQFSAETQSVIETLGNQASYLWEQTGGRNPDPADPWMIAVSKVHNYTIVTNESPKKSKSIPAACRLPSIECRCIRGPHFLIEVGLVTTINPETIDPQFFFDESQ